MNELEGKHLLIVGCGYVGEAVARAAMAGGARVSALTRNADKAAALRALGAEVVVADLATAEWHSHWRQAPDFLLNAVSSGGGGLEGYRRSYVEGMVSLAAWASQVGPVGTAVYTSSTSVYPQDGGVAVDETSPTGGGERAQLLLAAEETLRAARGAWRRWFILRLAGIYGPGRHYLLEQVRAGEVVGVGGHRLNLIHRDDAAGAVLAVLRAPPTVGSEILNVADDGAARKEEVAAWLAEQVGLPAPRFTGEASSLRRPTVPDRVILNAKLKAKLGWRPGFSTYRDGYGGFLSR